MKLKYFLVTFFCFAILQAQDKKVDFSKLDKKGMKTDLLLIDGSPFSLLGQKNDTYGMYGFEQTYKELAFSDAKNRFSNSKLLASEMREISTSEIIKIGLIHTDFEVISQKALDNGWIKIANKEVTRSSNNYIFKQYSNTIIAPLSLRKKGTSTIFNLDSRFFVNTTSNKILSVKGNFDDEKGFVNLDMNKNIVVKYATEGTKKIVFKILFENGTELLRYSNLEVTFSNADLMQMYQKAPTLITATRTPDLGLYGVTDLSPGKCEYEVFLSPDGILDKPIFLIDGFDPTDTRNIAAVYNLLNYTDAGGIVRNLGDKVRNENNFDVVIVNFPSYTNAAGNIIDGGADYIERNALSFINVVELINAQKVGTEQNVIIGPSMGGLVSRYALRYMETNSISPQTRLWISIDSPHYGANVSIGLQHLFNYFAYGRADSNAVKPLVNGTLRSPAAKQMLVDHFDAHTTNIAGVTNPTVPSTGLPLIPTGFPNVRNNFQNRMNTLGFPQSTRNVAITNGSGVGAIFNSIANGPVFPGFDLINSTINTGQVAGVNTRAITKCKFMPANNVQVELVKVEIQAQIFIWLTQDTFIANAKQNTLTNGVDSAPGGLFDILALDAGFGSDPILSGFISAMRAGYFDFIPTTSAIGLNVGGVVANNQPNYYSNINLGTPDLPWDGITTVTTNITPFKNWYLPPTNETHVKLTPANVDFTLNELINPNALSNQNFGFSGMFIKNPIDNEIEISSTKSIENAIVSLIDMTGKVILSRENQTINANYKIPVSISKGIYLLNIKNEEGNRTEKIIRN
jgi:Secretion system C-terminal sorting domain/PGAP1-like protein